MPESQHKQDFMWEQKHHRRDWNNGDPFMWTEAYQHLLSLISFSRNSVVDQRCVAIRSQQKRSQQQNNSFVRFARHEWAMEVEKTRKLASFFGHRRRRRSDEEMRMCIHQQIRNCRVRNNKSSFYDHQVDRGEDFSSQTNECKAIFKRARIQTISPLTLHCV